MKTNKCFRNAVFAAVLVAMCSVVCSACGKKSALRSPDGTTYPSVYPTE